MRVMSFALTAEQFRARSMTVTRRVGYLVVKPGDVLMAVVSKKGLAPGACPVPLGPIRVVSVRKERLHWITPADVARQGYPGMHPQTFVARFCKVAGRDVHAKTVVTRIEFTYLDPGDPEYPAVALGGAATGPGVLSPEDRPSPAPGPSEALQRPPGGPVGVTR